MKIKFKKLIISFLVPVLLAAAPGAPAARRAQADSSGLTYRIAPTKYETDEYIVSGLFINELDMDGNGLPDVTGDGVTDVTLWFQGAMDYLAEIGGGTLFIPEGKYVIRGTLTVPEGVVLAGDWKEPDEEGVHGTVLMAYSGRDDAAGQPFISVRQNAEVRDLNIWYPEQTADNIVPYPASVRLNDPSRWGADSTEVRNVTFVNAYYAIRQGPKMNGCPNVRNIYGTPLSMGVSMDGIADVGRFEDIHFSPEYWEKSGLPGAPDADGAHREYLYRHATAVSLARIDWSYLCHLYVDGYEKGVEMRHSTNDEAVDSDGNVLSYKYPNGQIYDVTIANGQYGFYVEGCSQAGELVSHVSIRDCETGIETLKAFHASGGNLWISDLRITGADTAVNHEGYMRLLLQNAAITSGDVKASNGITGIFDSELGGDVIFSGLAEQAMLCGNTFTGGHGIQNLSGCVLTEDREQTGAAGFGDFPDTAVRAGKPARAAIYVVTEEPYRAPNNGEGDASAAIQQALDDAQRDGGGIVFCPPGNYLLENQLTVYEGVELRGAIDKMRMPVNIGTIFNPDVNRTEAAVILKANSGIRGIVFDEAGQSCTGDPVEAPYTVQAQGENIYAVNLSLRNVYRGLDFFTYKCDNHLIDGLCGIAWSNMVRIGGNSENGRLFNCHFNWGPLFYGEQTKYGSWPNSPTPEERELYHDKMQSCLAQNLDCVVIGDCTDELLYNNFSIFGRYGLYLKDDGNGGPTGKILGQGIDGARVCIYTDTPQAGMTFLNTQLVSYKDGESAHIVTAESFGGTLSLINTSLWSSPDANLIANGGAIKLDNANFYNTGAVFAKPDGGEISVTNSYVNNTGTLYTGSGSGLYLKNLVVSNPVRDADALGGCVNVTPEAGRHDMPEDVRIEEGEEILFAEGFTDYPVVLNKGVENAVGRTSSFSSMSGITEASNITRVEADGNDYVRFYSSGTAEQAFLLNQSVYLESGNANSVYTVQARIRVDSLKTGGSFYLAVYNMPDENTRSGAIRIGDFSNGGIAVGGKGGQLQYEQGKWYRCVWKLDLKNTTQKTVTMYLYSDDGELLGQSQAVRLSNTYQNENALGCFQINCTKSNSGLEDEESIARVDYLVVSGEKEPEPTPTPEPTETPEGITDSIFADGSVTVRAKLDHAPAQAILVLYSEDVPVYTAAKDCSSSGSNEIAFDKIILSENIKDYQIKVFFWDSLSGMKPVHDIMYKK